MEEKYLAEKEDDVVESATNNSSVRKPRGKTGLFIVASMVLVACGFGMWSLTSSFVETGIQSSETSAGLHVMVGDTELTTSVVRLGVIDPENQSMVFGHDGLFVVLSESEDAPQLKLSKQSVDVLWLNVAFEIIGFDRDMTPDVDGVLHPLEGSMYGLVVRSGFFGDEVFVEGEKIEVTDPEKLSQ